MGKMKTQEQVVKEIKELLGDKILLDRFEYKGTDVKSTFGCKLHGFWEMKPACILRGSWCSECVRISKMKSEEQVILELREILGDKVLLDRFKYTGALRKSWFGCNVNITHGYWDSIVDSVLRGAFCPKCAGKNKTEKEVKDEIIALHGDNILLDKFEFKGYDINSLFGCGRNKEHGYWTATTQNIKHGRSCPKCAGKYKTTEERKKEIIGIHGDKLLLDKFEYIPGGKSNLIVGCNINKKHGYWTATIGNILGGKGCSKCKRSKGEVKIEDYFLRNNFEFITQFTSDGCRNHKTGRKLKFDFCKENLLVEYDGEQHFIQWGGKDKKRHNIAFKKAKYRDKLKNIFCKENKLNLLRIHYKDLEKIDEILSQVFEILSKKEYDKTKNSAAKLFNSTLFLNVV